MKIVVPIVYRYSIFCLSQQCGTEFLMSHCKIIFSLSFLLFIEVTKKVIILNMPQDIVPSSSYCIGLSGIGILKMQVGSYA